MLKNPPADVGDTGSIPGLERSPGAWRIPWTEEPAGLQSMGVAEEDTTEGLRPVVASPL